MARFILRVAAVVYFSLEPSGGQGNTWKFRWDLLARFLPSHKGGGKGTGEEWMLGKVPNLTFPHIRLCLHARYEFGNARLYVMQSSHVWRHGTAKPDSKKHNRE